MSPDGESARPNPGDTIAAAVGLIERELAERDLAYSVKSDHDRDITHLVVELPGEKKLKTSVLLSVSHHGVQAEAFVCRHPDENFEKVFRWLLKRNRRLYGVAYTLDNNDDIYLSGRIAAENVSGDELDRILGQVLEAADGDFNTILEMGFITSIRREYSWRVSRGESLANLKAFEHLIDPGSDHGPAWLRAPKSESDERPDS